MSSLTPSLKKFVYCVLLLPLLLVTAGCQPGFPYSQAEREYATGNYLASAGMFHKYAEHNSPQRYEAMYYEGMSWLNYGDVKKALDIFNTTIRFCDERRLRARAIAARGRCYIALGENDKAKADYQSLLEMYPDVFPPEQAREGLAQASGSVIVNNGLTLQPLASGQPLYRVRIRPHYSSKGAALEAMDRLKNSGVDVALSREAGNAGDEFIIQVGAFVSQARARARADSLRTMGWQTYILPRR